MPPFPGFPRAPLRFLPTQAAEVTAGFVGANPPPALPLPLPDATAEKAKLKRRKLHPRPLHPVAPSHPVAAAERRDGGGRRLGEPFPLPLPPLLPPRPSAAVGRPSPQVVPSFPSPMLPPAPSADLNLALPEGGERRGREGRPRTQGSPQGSTTAAGGARRRARIVPRGRRGRIWGEHGVGKVISPSTRMKSVKLKVGRSCSPPT